MRRTARVSRSSLPLGSCHTTIAAAKNSITESRPKPTRAIDEAMMPAVIAAAASTVIQAMLAYSSRKPRRRSVRRSSAVIMCSPPRAGSGSILPFPDRFRVCCGGLPRAFRAWPVAWPSPSGPVGMAGRGGS